MGKDEKCGLSAREITVKRVHPDPCWIIRDEADKASYANTGSLFVFSNQQLADGYIAKKNLLGATARKLSWNDLVDRFSQGFSEAMIDPSMDHDGFCTVCPFIKD